jgi:hypothetical protein
MAAWHWLRLCCSAEQTIGFCRLLCLAARERQTGPAATNSWRVALVRVGQPFPAAAGPRPGDLRKPSPTKQRRFVAQGKNPSLLYRTFDNAPQSWGLLCDARDIPYTYRGETTTILPVRGDFCPARGNRKTKPPLALVKLLMVLDRHPNLLNEVRAGDSPAAARFDGAQCARR